MKSTRFSSIYEVVRKILWFGFLIALPITSFPFFPGGIGGATLVRPLSLYPLLGLIVLVIIPVLLRKPLSKVLLPLLVFVLLAVISSLFALVQGIEPEFRITVGDRVLRNLITLGLGVLFYLAVALIPRSRAELSESIKVIYAGFAIALAWGSIQAIYLVSFNLRFFQFLDRIQRMISTRKLFRNRISGMTYEPNWFAEQITFLLMPWLFASVFTGYSIFKWRWRRVTVELLLLIWASVVLVFTYSRTGIILLFFYLLVGFFLFVRIHRIKKNWGQVLVKVGMIILIVAVLVGFIFVAAQRNNYFARIWTYFTEDAGGELNFFEYIAFNQRFIYWQTAYIIFDSHPFLGVGLGNYTFYFDEFMPDVELFQIPELLRKLTPSQNVDPIVTVKSLHVRILAETGIIGTAAFIAFVFSLAGCALWLYQQESLEINYWGVGSILVLLVLIPIGFSFDSFALPNMWVVFGLISAAYFHFRKDDDHLRTTKNTRPSLSGDSSGVDRS